MSFASFLLREVVIYCLFFFKTSFAAHLSAYATRRLLFTADIVSLSITPRPCLDPTTQWAAAAAPHSFISSPSPSRRQRNCCQQVTHSIKHPIRGYKQNTSYSLIAQAELCASQCYFFPFKQVKEPANRKSVRGLSWFVCFKFMNKWVGFFLLPKCESDAIKSKNTARKQLKKIIIETISMEEEGSDFWVLPLLLLLLLVDFTLLTTCVNQRFYMHLWQ